MDKDLLKSLLLAPKPLQTPPAKHNNTLFSPAPHAPPRSPSPQSKPQPLPPNSLTLSSSTPTATLAALPIAQVPHIVSSKGRYIAVDASFICYAVRGSKTRIICQNTGLSTLKEGNMSLLKNKSESVDMALCEGNLIQATSSGFVITQIGFDGTLQQWNFTTLLEISTHAAFSAVGWSGSVFGACCADGLYIGSVDMLHGLSGKQDLELDGLAEIGKIALVCLV